MEEMLELIIKEQQKQEAARITACNQKTARFGLVLTQEDTMELLAGRKGSLQEQGRVEFTESILPELVEAFCNSQYIHQDNYKDTIMELQELFYQYKNESLDELTDRELIDFMKQQFEEVCFGDLEYLGTTCMERFARALRAGYVSRSHGRLRDEYGRKETENEYDTFSEETGWEYELYRISLEDQD